jgi:hypothetical protein
MSARRDIEPTDFFPPHLRDEGRGDFEQRRRPQRRGKGGERDKERREEAGRGRDGEGRREEEMGNGII